MKTHNFNRKHHLTKRKHKLTKRKHKGNKKTQVKRRTTRRNRKHRQTGGDITPSPTTTTKSPVVKNTTPSTNSIVAVPSVQNLSPKDQLRTQLKELEVSFENAKKKVEELEKMKQFIDITIQGFQNEQEKDKNKITQEELKFVAIQTQLEEANAKVLELEGKINNTNELIKVAPDEVQAISKETMELAKKTEQEIEEKKEKVEQMTKATAGGLVGMVVSYIFENFGTEKIKGVLNTMFDQIKLTDEEKRQIFTILDKKLNELQNSAQ
jgi:DNA repair exonuclease SbcCD ATPase subunit